MATCPGRPAFAQAPAPPPSPPPVTQPPAPGPPPAAGQVPSYGSVPGFGQPPGLGQQPGYNYGQQPGAIQPTPVQPDPFRPPAPGEQPVTPGVPAPTPVPVLVPVIPDVQPVGPPTTIPSAPPRLLPAPGIGLPVTATFQFEPTLTVLEEYTDNFNLTKSNKQENFRSTLSPGFRLGINSPLTKGLIAYTFSPSYDTATKDISLFHSVLGQVVWQANPRWQLTVADTFTRSDQPGEADRLGLRQERRSFSTNTFSATSQYLIDLITTRQSYRLSTFEEDDDGGKTTSHDVGLTASLPIYQTNVISAGYAYLNSETTEGSGGSRTGARLGSGRDFNVQGHEISGSVSRRLTALSTAGLKGSYAFRNVTSERRGDIDYRLWTASMFSSYTLPARLALDGSLGVSALSTDSGASAGPNFFSASSLTWDFVRAVFRLAIDRGFSETFSEGENFGVVETEGYTASLTYHFTPSISATASGSYRRNKTTGIGNEVGRANEDSTNFGGSMLVTWRIMRALLLDLTYSYFQQVGEDNGTGGTTGTFGNDRSYTENRVQAAFRFTF